MITRGPETGRTLRTESIEADLVVVGGGLAGTCAAITAAREGCRVVLVQDRPVLGGNASSEVRLWALGATSHMGNNNRWAREGGVANELIVENLYRNREGNPVVFDTVLLDYVLAEPNLRLLLNTAACDVQKSDAATIRSVRAFCPQNQTAYVLGAPLFLDTSGDGILGFLAGAAFRMGAEAAEEFGEKFAPGEEYGELLGHSIYFYSKDTGRPVTFVPPRYALQDVPGRIPRFRRFNTREHGCTLWWIEYGGRLDTVHDTEQIKWELWKVVYGVWDYIKNSGNFPEAGNLTLEWVGAIPGKRESRRFEGDYLLRQQDIVEQRKHEDDIAFGGWSIDLHPADGVFSEKPGCNQFHAQGTYPIPYRCCYSRNIRNLFIGGRLLSATHVAFGSTRVMLTCAHAAQAAGVAAAICREQGCLPRDVGRAPRIAELQRRLLCAGQHIPRVPLNDSENLAARARITASSTFTLGELPDDGEPWRLERDLAQMIPGRPGPAPRLAFTVDAEEPTTLELELRTSAAPFNHSPQVVLASGNVALEAGAGQSVPFDFDVTIAEPRYLFYVLRKNPKVRVHTTTQRLTGVLSLSHRRDQKPERDVGVEHFEFWAPGRRPGGLNAALRAEPAVGAFGVENLCNGYQRPTEGPNAWLAALDDPAPSLALEWDEPQPISRVELWFDVDYDHPMESAQYGHPESVVPFVVESATLHDESGREVGRLAGNHHARATWHWTDDPVHTRRLEIRGLKPHGPVPAAVFEVRCYG